MFDVLNNLLDNYPLIDATKTTLMIAVISLVFGLIFAFIITILELARFKPVAWLISMLVIIIRGLPEILVVIGVYNGIPLILIFIADNLLQGGTDITIPLYFTQLTMHLEITDFNISPIFCGIVALSTLYAAYASQTLRGAFKAVPNGQTQAAQVLGLSKFRTLTHIVIPQMWRHALPGLGNQWLVLLKDTALVSLITVNDIMLQTRTTIASDHQPFTGYLIAAAIYLVISIISQKILKVLEKRSLYFEQPAAISKG